MSNNKQSSVEWLKHSLEEYGDSEKLKITWKDFDELIRYAKAMHKEEIIESWHNGYNNQSPMIDEENCGEQYFKETFGSPR